MASTTGRKIIHGTKAAKGRGFPQYVLVRVESKAAIEGLIKHIQEMEGAGLMKAESTRSVPIVMSISGVC